MNTSILALLFLAAAAAVAQDCSDIIWTTDGRCGPDYGNQVCNNANDGKGNLWTYCSDWNWCGDSSAHNVGNTDFDFPGGDCVPDPCTLPNTYLNGHAGDELQLFDSITDAMAECLKVSDCGGITHGGWETEQLGVKTSSGETEQWTLRSGTEPMESPIGETSLLRSCFGEATPETTTVAAPAQGQPCLATGPGGVGRCTPRDSCGGDWSGFDDDFICNYDVDEVCCHVCQDTNSCTE